MRNTLTLIGQSLYMTREYTLVSRASAHSRLSAQMLVLAAQMESAHSRVSAQARSLQSHMASTRTASVRHGAYIQARFTERSYTKAWPTISLIMHRLYQQQAAESW